MATDSSFLSSPVMSPSSFVKQHFLSTYSFFSTSNILHIPDLTPIHILRRHAAKCLIKKWMVVSNKGEPRVGLYSKRYRSMCHLFYNCFAQYSNSLRKPLSNLMSKIVRH